MLILKHLKTLQHVSIIIQIIFRELECSLLKSLNLKVFIIFFKIVKVIFRDAAAQRLVCLRGVLCGEVCWTACSPAYLSTQNAVQYTSPHRTQSNIPLHTEHTHAHTHTPNVTLPHHHIDFLHF
jgi:hypothetical protein